MSDKALCIIDEYFKRWHRDIEKARELVSSQRYYLEGLLVLSCYLGAFASVRFPTLRDGEAYVKVVLEYSGKRGFYEQIDLLFFYQQPRSKLRERGNYKVKNHSEIVDALKRVYGTEEDIKVGTRYVSPSEMISHIISANIPNFDEQNFRGTLPLFCLAEILYRYLRCDAVHNNEFPFVNKLTDIEGNVTYEENHAITGNMLLETTEGVLKMLRDECLAKAKWPQEL